MMSVGVASLAWFKSERIHWVGIIVVSPVVLGLALRLSVGLVEAAA